MALENHKHAQQVTGLKCKSEEGPDSRKSRDPSAIHGPQVWWLVLIVAEGLAKVRTDRFISGKKGQAAEEIRAKNETFMIIFSTHKLQIFAEEGSTCEGWDTLPNRKCCQIPFVYHLKTPRSHQNPQLHEPTTARRRLPSPTATTPTL